MDCVLPEYKYMRHIVSQGISTPITSLNLENTETPTRHLVNNKFAFYCPYISTKVMDEIGYIDERFVTFTDDDTIVRALLKGLIVEETTIQIHHKGSHIDQLANGSSLCGSYNQDQLNRDHFKYQIKWNIPNNLTHDQYIPWILENYVWDERMRIE